MRPPAGTAALVFFLSAGLLALEVSLLRWLLVVSFHHFAFLVLSVAMLGFGASGGLVARLRHRTGDPRVLHGLTAAALVSVPLAVGLAQRVPVESRIAPALLLRQLGSWLLCWGLLAVPFLLGAGAVCWALAEAEGGEGRVYAANLAGSAAGALAAPLLMGHLPPETLPVASAALALPALASAPRRWLLGVILGGAAILQVLPPLLRHDPFQYRAFLTRLERQGSATRIAHTRSVRGEVEVLRSDSFHQLPFLGVGHQPPPLDVLVIDGHPAGSLLRVEGAHQAEAMEHTLMALPYALLGPSPRVALLEERAGADVWLARRRRARRIAVVQPDPALHRLLAGELSTGPGSFLRQEGVEVHLRTARGFLEVEGPDFDLIQLVGLQALTAGSGGLAGLGENDLVTVQGFDRALDRLAPGGLLSITRGLQDPPRDIPRLVGTALAALRARGIVDPGARLALVRDYLGLVLMVRERPFGAGEVARLRAEIARRQLTPVWFPGIEEEELNRPDHRPGPPGAPGDWLHFTTREMLEGRGEALVEEWTFDIRPPTDDRPFFHDFSRLDRLARIRDALGETWWTRAELTRLFVLVSLLVAALAGGLLALLPLAGTRSGGGKTAVALYFASLGLAYMLLELAALSLMTRLVGDPVLAGSLTISAFLVASGGGAWFADRVASERPALGPRLVGAVGLVGPLALLVLERAAEGLAGSPVPTAALAGVAIVLPPAFLMGFGMPLGLARLSRSGAGELVPWAWAVNGFASVVSSSLALLLAMSWGYSRVGLVAGGLYLLAGGLQARLGGK